MNNRTIKIFPNIEKLANYFADLVVSKLNENLAGNSFSIALSGGSTPEKIYKYIADNYIKTIDWKKLKIFFGDERCVTADDNESNFKMVNNTLLKYISIPNENIFRIKGEDVPSIEAARYSEIIKKNLTSINGLPQFDFVLLGLGEDGHTASIFPDQIEKFNSKKICEVGVHPETGQNRITITGEVINNAKLVVFIVTGENKSKIVSEILSGNTSKTAYPATLVNPKEGELIWLLDDHSAKLMRHMDKT